MKNWTEHFHRLHSKLHFWEFYESIFLSQNTLAVNIRFKGAVISSFNYETRRMTENGLIRLELR